MMGSEGREEGVDFQSCEEGKTVMVSVNRALLDTILPNRCAQMLPLVPLCLLPRGSWEQRSQLSTFPGLDYLTSTP